MDYWKEYKDKYNTRIYKEIMIALCFAGVLSYGHLTSFPLWFFGILLLLDIILIRIDKIIEVLK